MANDVLKMKWVEKDGSVFVAEPEWVKLEGQKKSILVHKSVAFNVGRVVGQRIVNAHNAMLAEEELLRNGIL